MDNQLLLKAVHEFAELQGHLLSLWRAENPSSVDMEFFTDFPKTQKVHDPLHGEWMAKLHGSGVAFVREIGEVMVDVPYGVEYASLIEPNRVFDYLKSIGALALPDGEVITRDFLYSYFDQCVHSGRAKEYRTSQGKRLYSFSNTNGY